MAHPLATKAISSARVKNDSVDVKTLAHLLRSNLLPEAWIAPPEAREARRLARMRTYGAHADPAHLPGPRAACRARCATEDDRRLRPRREKRFLAELELPEISRARIEANVRLAERSPARWQWPSGELRSLFRGDDRLARLTRIPGIGFITAATVITEVWDVSRFDTADRLCSWAGLTPSERSSAEHTRRGHISKQGSRWLRWVLVEAATRPQRDPDLRASSTGLPFARERRSVGWRWPEGSSRSVTTPFGTGAAVAPTQQPDEDPRRGRGALVSRHGLLRTAAHLIEPPGPHDTMDQPE
jgi:transposase